MSSDYDASEFVDGDLENRKSPFSATTPAAMPQAGRAPTREEVNSRVTEAQQKLAELRRAQEDLERERAALEETRRRQMEFQTGRQEIVQHLTRGIGLLEEAEMSTRREAEQMAKTLAGATRPECSAATQAADKPAGPAPTMATSLPVGAPTGISTPTVLRS